MSKCQLVAPQLHQLTEEHYAELANIACQSFLATTTSEYEYDDDITNLLYIIRFSLETEGISERSWHNTCYKIFDESSDPQLDLYKLSMGSTLELTEDGCHKTVDIICKPQTKELLYNELDARPFAKEFKQEIKEYIEMSICGQHSDVDAGPMLFATS